MKLTLLFEMIDDPTYGGQLQLPKNGLMLQTSRGSRYVWDPSSKTTTRWKSYHPEHGAKQQTGAQDSSQKTIFITSEYGFEFADVLAWKGERTFKFYTRGDKIFLYSKHDNAWGDPIKFSWRPRPGMYPLEFWKIKKHPDGYKSAGVVHLGNEISKMSDAPF